MAMRVSYGMRDSELDGQNRSFHGVRQIAKPPCNSLEEAIDAIKADIQAGEESEVPGCTTSEITLGYEAVLELHRPNIGPYSEGGEHDLPAAFKTGWTGDENDGMGSRGYPTASVDAITGYGDKASRAVVQRAASRAIVAAIEAADGFKYSMNNAWAAKDADGQRFSYICQDSMQNKDRHANGFTRTLKHLKGEHERGPRKPTYDCKGSISIKCSLVRRTIDIFYRHYAIHSSVAERRAAPRPQRPRISTGGEDGAVRKPAETGGLLGRLQNEESAFAPPLTPGSGSRGVSNISRPLKRKRDSDTPSRPGKPLSLVELLKQSEAQEKSKTETPEKPSPTPTAAHPPPMNYDLPSWQAPPPPPPAPKVARAPVPQQQSNYPPYQPPYQPPLAQQSPYSQHPPPQQTPTSAHPHHTPSQHNPGYYGLTPAPSHNAGNPSPNNPKAAAATPLFTTMKPFRVETPLTLYSGRTRSSCTNCRYGKKKCDEARPTCTPCVKSGKYDCAYDGAYGYPASAGQQAGMGGWVATPVGQEYPPQQKGYPGFMSQPHNQQQYPTPAQSQSQSQSQGSAQEGVPPMSQYAQTPAASGGVGEREDSPDPWFPKR